MYVNGEYRGDSDLGKLMHDFNCTDAEDMYFDLLAEKTRYLKENPKGVNEMCKVMEDLRNESYAEGREEQAKITAFRMGKKGRSPEEIAELIDFDVETVKNGCKLQKSKRIKECSQNRRATADWKLSIVNFEAGKNV